MEVVSKGLPKPRQTLSAALPSSTRPAASSQKFSKLGEVPLGEVPLGSPVFWSFPSAPGEVWGWFWGLVFFS